MQLTKGKIMELKIHKYSIEELNIQAYVLLVVSYVMTNMLVSANWATITNIATKVRQGVTIVLMFFLIVNIFGPQKISIKKATLSAILGIIILLLYFNGNSNLIIPFLLVIDYPKNLESKRLARDIYLGMLTTIFLVIVLCFVGYFKDITVTEHGTVRHTLGFVAANTLGNYVLITFLLKVYSKWEEWNFKDTIIWGGIMIAMYLAVNSRASFFYGIVLLIAITLCKKKTQIVWRYFSWLPIILFLVTALISIVGTIYFSHNQNYLYYKASELFLNRPFYMVHYYDQYGISLWGQAIDTVSRAIVLASNNMQNWWGLDNSYIYILINDGVVSLFIYFVIFLCANIQVVRTKNLGGLAFLTIFSVLGLTENYMRLIWLNFAFFIFASYLSSNKELKFSVKKSEIDSNKEELIA